eukprot:m51a1_g4539 putative nod3 protein (333) ;mRNA; f:43200-44697
MFHERCLRTASSATEQLSGALARAVASAFLLRRGGIAFRHQRKPPAPEHFAQCAPTDFSGDELEQCTESPPEERWWEGSAEGCTSRLIPPGCTSFEPRYGVDCHALAQELCANTSLTELVLVGRIGCFGAARIAEALRQNCTLKRLVLQGSDIGFVGAGRIAEALARNSSLTALSLRDGRIEDEGAVRVAEALKSNTSLQYLGLEDNRVGDAGAARLAEALSVNNTVVCLGLSFNEIGDRGARHLALALAKNLSLVHMGIGLNKMSKRALAGMREAAQSRRAVRREAALCLCLAKLERTGARSALSLVDQAVLCRIAELSAIPLCSITTSLV